VALIKCSECGKEMSDHAKICPNCGCIIDSIKNTNNASKKRNSFLKNKKVWIVLSVIIIIMGIVIISFFNLSDSNIIRELNIEEGCYAREDDKENLICFTKGVKFHNVLYKYDTYWNDKYANIPPKDDPSYGTTEFSFNYDKKTITTNVKSKGPTGTARLERKCSVVNSTTIECYENQYENHGDGEKIVEDLAVKRIYIKVNKDFNEEIINEFPIFERIKPFKINFDGEEITCNLTWKYSQIRISGPVAIKDCLENKYNTNYTVSNVSEDDNRWLIFSSEQSEAAEKIFPKVYGTMGLTTNPDAIKYIKANYSYYVKVDDREFRAFEDFPIDPYNQDELMTVSITTTKEDKNKEYGLYELQKKYIDTTINYWGSSYEFTGSKNGVFATLINGKLAEIQNNPVGFTYEHFGNTISIDGGDVICKLYSDSRMECKAKNSSSISYYVAKNDPLYSKENYRHAD